MGTLRHGQARRGAVSPEYRIWKGIITRCCNPRSKGFAYYGARGITVATEWRHDFEAFLKHVGTRPSRLHSIERLDNSRGYEPGNLAWRTTKEQALNRRSNRLVTVDGETAPVGVWLERTGLSRATYKSRKADGWSDEDAVTTPVVPPKERRRHALVRATSPASARSRASDVGP